MECKHFNFDGLVNVARVTKENSDEVIYFSADIEIMCRDCGNKFRFKGLPVGFHPEQTRVSIFGTQLRAAIEPSDEYVSETPSNIANN